MVRFFSLAILTILTNCSENIRETDSQQNKNKEDVRITTYFEYEGIIPCADCEGIKIKLKIANDFQNYELTEEYFGEDDSLFKESGSLNTERGFEEDLDATVYVLNFDKPETEQRYFVRLSSDNSRLLMLDRNKERIKSELNYSLVRK